MKNTWNNRNINAASVHAGLTVNTNMCETCDKRPATVYDKTTDTRYCEQCYEHYSNLATL